MTGFLALLILSQCSRRPCFTLAEYVWLSISLISAPAAKAFSLPVSMIAATLLSASNCCTAAATSDTNTSQRAFKDFGRVNCTMPTFVLSNFVHYDIVKFDSAHEFD
uniref:Uncharacterized protein n=1 Tax=Cacopsylla melanoneura TaxID=428564 RepID=A0A8D9BTZ1_9HEMI